MLTKGQVSQNRPQETPKAYVPPDVHLRRQQASSQASPAAPQRSILGRLVGLLDKPYEWVSKGSRLVGWLARRATEEKRKGDTLEGLAYSIGASAAAFITGAAAGITGIISPKAWRETLESLRHPSSILEAVKENPLTVSYIAGSIVGPAKLFKLAEARLARVREPDLAVTDSGSLTFHAVKTREGVKWVARLEAEGPARPVGKAVSVSAKPVARSLEVETGRARIGLVEARKGSVLRRLWRVEYRDTGKRVMGLEEWRFSRLGSRYRYKGLIVDPVRPQARLLERPAEWPEYAGIRDIYAVAPPRVVVAPKLGGLGLLGLAGGLAGVSRSGVVRESSASILLGTSLTTTSLTTPSHKTSSTPTSASTGSPASLAALGFTPPSKSKLKELRLPGGGTDAPLARGGRRRREYSEIVYPKAVLPL